MARVELDEVLDILETDLTPDDLRPFVAGAHRIVEDNLVGREYTRPDGTVGAIGEDSLKEIERWLSAHLAAMWDKRVAKDKVGPADFTYEGETGMYLDFTRYGQQAALLDPTGTLKEIGSTEAAGRVPFLYSVSGGTPQEEAAPEGALR